MSERESSTVSFLNQLPVRPDVRRQLAGLDAANPLMLLEMFRASPVAFARWLGSEQANRIAEYLEAMLTDQQLQSIEHPRPVTPSTGVPLTAPPPQLAPLAYQLAERDRLHAAYVRSSGGSRGVTANPKARPLEEQILSFLDPPPRVVPPRDSPVGWLLPYLLVSPYRAAPERSHELKSLVASLGITFEFVSDPTESSRIFLKKDTWLFGMISGGSRIVFGLDFAERLWAYSYAYFQILQLVQNRDWGGVDLAIPEPARSMLEAAFVAEREGVWMDWQRDWPWPVGAEQPRADNPVATELFLIIGAWVLLHEIGHAACGHAPDALPTLWKEEEFQADDWAFDWMLGRWQEYGDQPDDEVFLKRALGAVFFLAHIAGLEAHTRTRGGTSHPDPVERLFRFLERHVPCADGSRATRRELPWWVAMVIVQLHLTAAGKPIPASESFHDARSFLQEVVKRLA